MDNKVILKILVFKISHAALIFLSKLIFIYENVL
jgi:hypothetical protein